MCFDLICIENIIIAIVRDVIFEKSDFYLILSPHNLMQKIDVISRFLNKMTVPKSS